MVSRRILTLVAGAALLAALAGCARKGGNAASQTPAPAQPFKIGIMTGTASLAGADFRAGEQVERRYPGRVMHVTYPDDFASELIATNAWLARERDELFARFGCAARFRVCDCLSPHATLAFTTDALGAPGVR